jgi:hypothetical protein
LELRHGKRTADERCHKRERETIFHGRLLVEQSGINVLNIRKNGKKVRQNSGKFTWFTKL